MRIGIDAHILGKNKGGVERYVKEMVSLLPDLMPDDHFYIFISQQSSRGRRRRSNVTYIKLPFSDPLLQRAIALPLATVHYRLDIVHVQRILPLFYWGTAVVTVHDLLPITDPEHHPGFRNVLIRRLTGHSVRKAGRVLTVSRSVQADIVRRFRIGKNKCVAIYNGIDHNHFNGNGGNKASGNGEQETAQKLNLLYIGAIEPRKNLDIVLKALDILRREPPPDITLTIIGGVRDKAYAAHVKQLVLDLGLTDAVSFTGYVSDDRCLDFLRVATVFLAPSKGEGFDLPPVEAMAYGVPVICSDIPVHREILASCAVFFPAQSPEKLADCIRMVIHNPSLRERLHGAGQELAKKFTWKETACRIANVYRAIGREKSA